MSITAELRRRLATYRLIHLQRDGRATWEGMSIYDDLQPPQLLGVLAGDLRETQAFTEGLRTLVPTSLFPLPRVES